MKQEKILITGALGQIGSELTASLREIYGAKNVIATDIRTYSENEDIAPYVKLDVTDYHHWKTIIQDFGITQVYHLAAMLSATSEKMPEKAWNLNTSSLVNLLEFAKEGLVDKVFWPSSIAVFGEGIEKDMVKQKAVRRPYTLYGISKLAGENLCAYYAKKFNIDVRSIRYPGLISYKTPPGGGTTDYAVEMFYKALEKEKYHCFLSENTTLPMLYMEDAIRGTIELMQAPAEKLRIRSSYNMAGISFSPIELASEIQKHLPDFEIVYNPDYRQQLATSWPKSIDDEFAQKDWGWKSKYTLEQITQNMLQNLSNRLETV